MAILKIAKMGHPVLMHPAAAVDDPGAPEIRRLIADMIETMADADGAGLAAPQVHAPLRVVVFYMPDADDGRPDREQAAPVVLINPAIEPLTEATETDWEGCLSVPGMIGAVPRFTRVRYRAVTPEGEPVDRVVSGFHARVVQHECDHLEGILYPQRMTDLKLLLFRDQMRYHRPDGAAAEEGEDEEYLEA